MKRIKKISLPSQRNSTFTVVLRVGWQETPGTGQTPQYLGRKRFLLLQGPKRRNTAVLRRCVALHSCPLWNNAFA